MISFGIESGNQNILKKLDKQITLKQVKLAVKICKKYKIKVMGYFMIGNPTETLKLAQSTINFSRNLGLDYAAFDILNALPNTKLFNNALKDGTLNRKRYYKVYKSLKSPHNFCYIDNAKFPINKQKEVFIRANKMFYLRILYILKSLFNIRSLNDFKNKFLLFLRFLTW